jgi:hypothetical protein
LSIPEAFAAERFVMERGLSVGIIERGAILAIYTLIVFCVAHQAMKNMNANRMLLVAQVCAAIALVSCRREEAYEPLKLGGPAADFRAR